jgi:PAS domain S-box-containing protein
MDPTESLRREVNAALSARQLELIVNRVPAFIAQLDGQGRFAYINDAYAAFFRRPRAEIIGREPREVFSTADFRQIEQRVASVLSGEAHSYQRQVTDADGVTSTLQVELLPETPGERGGLVVIAHDITGLKNAEERFSLHSRVLGSMTESVLLLDEEGVVVYHNAAAERDSGLPSGRIVGKHFLSLQAGGQTELAARFAEAREKTLSGGAWSGEWLTRREGGGVYPTHAEISGFVMSERPFLIVVQRDISHEKRASEALAFSELRFRFLAEAMPQMAWLAGA